jgi:UDP-N-acetylmuramate: L-alanyl-gamma-D-glutamyl-meso-diaminopimelate ligase
MEKVHFIAIGGSAMHNLALAMHEQGVQVSGSDDEIFEPSRTRLQVAGLLPSAEGWFPEKITKQLDAVILGMHARADNPELLKAKELNLPVFSYPGYIYQVSRDKKRIVIGGSHGKTSITAMVLHVLGMCSVDADYLVGAQLKGYKTMVKLTKEAPLVLLEGDEYLSSAIERVPKFHLYQPHVAVLSGIAWDHINVFPTFENYVDQFRIFIDKIEPGGVLFYYGGDPELTRLAQQCNRRDIMLESYDAHEAEIRNGLTYLKTPQGDFELRIFGKHNLQNLEAARRVCLEAGVQSIDFYKCISSFEGAARRLERVYEGKNHILFKDFAHSPSKLKATTDAVKQQFSAKPLLACMELHTFSSLNAEFLEEYKGCMDTADRAIVYYNPHTVAHKKLNEISPAQVKAAFNREDLIVFNDSALMLDYLKQNIQAQEVILMMTSGNFDGIRMEELPLQLHLS